MKKHLFIFLSISLISLWISCSDNNSDMAIESVAQTHWKGSYQNAGKTISSLSSPVLRTAILSLVKILKKKIALATKRKIKYFISHAFKQIY